MIAAGVFFVVFFLCVLGIMRHYIDLRNAEMKMDELREEYVNETHPVVSESIVSENVSSDEVLLGEKQYPGTEGYEVPNIDIDFDALQTENEHIYAWINVPGTDIDYPVLQHPEDNTFYLEHNIDGSEGYPGCIYTEYYNSKNWEDKNTILYGHNMRDGSMFADLHDFENQENFDENRFIYIFTEEQIFVYEIFAAYEYSDAHILLGYDTRDEDYFADYIEEIYKNEGENNHFDTDIPVTPEDRMITLSTCVGGQSDRRFLVQGVLVAIGNT